MESYEGGNYEFLYASVKTTIDCQVIEYADIYIPASIRHLVANAMSQLLRFSLERWYAVDTPSINSELRLEFGGDCTFLRAIHIRVTDGGLHHLAPSETAQLQSIRLIEQHFRQTKQHHSSPLPTEESTPTGEL